MDIQNHYYGHSAALARYAGLFRIRHIHGLVQHGWTVKSPNLVHFSDFATLPRTARRLVWSHSSRGWAPQEEEQITTAIGAPFLYLNELTKEQSLEPLGKTVAFPVHDTRLVQLGSQGDDFAALLAAQEGPSIVCLHPEDLLDPGRISVWTSHGHTVVSAGERRDPHFLGRVLRLVRSASRVVSNQLSTAVMYAAAVGTPTDIYGPEVSIGALGTGVARRTRELWPEFHEDYGVTDLQEIALSELGAGSLMDPDLLRLTLGWDHPHVTPFVSYWAGAPLRKAGAVLGLVSRPAGAEDAGAGVSPLAFLRHPLSHLPSALPALGLSITPLPLPLRPEE